MRNYRIINVIDCKDLLFVQAEFFLLAPDKNREQINWTDSNFTGGGSFLITFKARFAKVYNTEDYKLICLGLEQWDKLRLQKQQAQPLRSILC